MRKFTLLILAALLVTFADAQRTVLIQKGSNASCAPCAASNPAFWALMQPNIANHKVVYISYQWDFPGTDPMNAQNPVDPDAFMAYYSQNGVPTCLTDGENPRHIANHSQALIDAAYAIPTPLSMTVSHTMNSSFSQATITIVVTNNGATAVGGGQYKLRTLFTEEVINFATAPGSNGERTFHHVARKHLPDWAGTALPSIAPGASQTFTLTENVPTYYYDVSKLNVVAYVQDDASKKVWQAAESNVIPVPLNASITGATIAGTGICMTSITPKATLTNLGTDPLTSATVGYAINGGTPVTQAWTGNLATGATADVTFAAVTLAPGSSTSIVYTATSVNGATDQSPADNTTTAVSFVNLDGAAAAMPYSEGFESLTTVGVAPRVTNAFTVDYATDDFVMVTSGAATGTRALRWNCWNRAAGTTATTFLTKIRPSASTNLGFKIAHRQYTGSEDRLQFVVSTNCGQTWTPVFNETSSQFAHSAQSSGSATPTLPVAANWRNKLVSLSAYAGQDIMVAVKCISDFGDYIYVDDINIDNALSIEDMPEVASFNLFPNPTNGDITIDLNLENQASVNMSISNALGQHVKNVVYTGTSQMNVATSDLAAGTYFFNVVIDGKVQAQRFVVIK